MEKISFDSGASGDITLAVVLAAIQQTRLEILQAVSALQLGDDAIGDAITRYEQKMAVVNGGME